MAHQPDQDPEIDPEELAHAAAEESSESSLLPGGSLIGQTLEGRYRFDELLGEGTFARVYRVYDLHRRVNLAAKVLRSDIAHEPAFLARFKREAAVLARLQHPNIVRYYDIVESGRQVFILTDYIAGDTLQWRLRERDTPITPFESLDILRPLAAALHYAHREDVVHRDLKPANILIDDNNNVYVTDFGIAKILSDTSTLTVDMTVGTPHYMSPEQIQTASVTPATDVYALGVVLYQMYTGQLPFVGDSDEAPGTTAAVRIVYEHLNVPPPRPTLVNRRLSVAVEEVILKALAKDPADRYASVSDLYDALTDAIGTPSISLDADAVAMAQRSTEDADLPEAERVPTGVGGLSQVLPDRDALLGTDAGEGDYYAEDDEMPHDSMSRRAARKAKRKAKREARRAARNQEKGGEKQAEKEREYQEKEAEKGPEKAQMWSTSLPDDVLSQMTTGLSVIWAGVVFALGFDPWWAWMVGGLGGIMLTEVAVRLVVPEYRAVPGLRLMLGAGLFAWGVGSILSIGSIWAIILIAVGVSMLASRMFVDDDEDSY